MQHPHSLQSGISEIKPAVSIVWYEAQSKSGDVPAFKTRAHHGALAEAVELLRSLANGVNFVLGQVLEPDGRIFVTIPACDFRRVPNPDA